MKKIIFALLIGVLGIVSKAAQPGARQYNLDVKDFASLQVVDGLNVVYKCSTDSAGIATFETTDDKVSMILFSNDKSTLKIQLQTDGQTVTDLPTITVRSNYLSTVENSGDSTITVLSPAPAAEIKLRVIGNGTIVAKGLHATAVQGKIDTGRGRLVLQGITQWAKFRTVGSGCIEAGELKADKGNFLIGGTGSVDCYVTGELNIKGLGSGKIYYRGTPTIKNRTLGTVKAIKVE
jgi:hypothetical protein